MKHGSMTNLRLPPRYRVRCHAQRAAAAPWPRPRRHAGHAGQRGRRCSLPPCSIAPPAPFPLPHPRGPAHVAVGCSISSAPHAPAPLLYTRTPSAYSPAPSPAISSMVRVYPCHADATRMQRRPLPLHSPEQHTRRCAARWPRRRWIYFRKQTKCKKKARAAARRYSTGLRGA